MLEFLRFEEPILFSKLTTTLRWSVVEFCKRRKPTAGSHHVTTAIETILTGVTLPFGDQNRTLHMLEVFESYAMPLRHIKGTSSPLNTRGHIASINIIKVKPLEYQICGREGLSVSILLLAYSPRRPMDCLPCRSNRTSRDSRSSTELCYLRGTLRRASP